MSQTGYDEYARLITHHEARLEELLRCCLVALYERQVEQELTEEIEGELAAEERHDYPR